MRKSSENEIGKRLLTFGLKEDRMVNVKEVSTGLACECFCPDPTCKSRLVAKNTLGNIRVKHFAHESGATCIGAFESAQHLLAKQILKESKKVWLPSFVTIDLKDRAKEIVNKGRLVQFERIELEMRVNLELSEYFVPDAKCFGEYGKVLFVEIAKTHFVDENKGLKIAKAGVSTIEIDISDLLLNEGEIRLRIEGISDRKKWLFNKAFSKVLYLGSGDFQEQLYDEKLREQLIGDIKEGGIFIKVFEERARTCPKLTASRESKIRELKNSKYYKHGVLKSILDQGGWDGKFHSSPIHGKCIRVNGLEKPLFMTKAIYLEMDQYEESRLFEKGLMVIAKEILFEGAGFCQTCSFNKGSYNFFNQFENQDMVRCGFQTDV